MKEVQSHTDAIQKTPPTIVAFIEGGAIVRKVYRQCLEIRNPIREIIDSTTKACRGELSKASAFLLAGGTPFRLPASKAIRLVLS